VSPEEIGLALTVAAIGLCVAAEILQVSGRVFERLQLLLLLLCGSAGLVWLLGRRYVAMARWVVVLVLIVTVHTIPYWLGTAGAVVLIALPVATAAVLISLWAALATAVAQTGLIILSISVSPGVMPLTDAPYAILAIWASVALMWSALRRFLQVLQWSEEHFEETQRLLEDARDRKVELEEVLEELVHSNRELSLANERIARLRMVAEEAQKAKAAFVARVSHEFRTPLNMITGLAGLLVGDPEIYEAEIPAAVTEDLRIIQRNCDHLSSLVDDVLALSQAEAGRTRLQREWVDLGDVVTEAVDVVRPLLEKKRLEMRVSAAKGLPKVYCDRVRIRQVVLNLVSNAARYTDTGGVSVDVTANGERVTVSVSDTGPGIAPEDAKVIFEPFFRGSGGAVPGGGTGLGLSISKGFIELHGGRIWLESEVGVGSRFSFELPLSLEAPHVARPGHQIREEWPWRERPARPEIPRLPYRERIVVCDPEEALLTSLSHYSNEVEFVVVRSASEVVREVRESPAHAVLVNVSSPALMWKTVLDLRSAISETPVVGCSIAHQSRQAQLAGAMCYLIKPVRREDLQEVLARVGREVRRVLVVDDDLDILQLLVRMLRVCERDLEVKTATDGSQALEILRRYRPDLVLLDLVMPVMDGWAVLEEKRGDAAIRGIPTVLVTAQDPMDYPPASAALTATISGGVPIGKVLRSALKLSSVFLEP